MSLVPSFLALLQPFAVVMTTPSFDSAVMLATGWIFASRRTVTRMIVAAGAVGTKHHSAFHRLFASARWSLDQVGLLIFDRMTPWLDDVIMLAADDTLAHKRGPNVYGAGMHRDPLLSSRSRTVTTWSHNWVILGVLVRFPLWPERVFCLPILFRLYLNQKSAAKRRRVYRTRPELLVEMLKALCESRKTRRFHLVADSSYGGQSVHNYLPANCDLTSRLPMNARLHGPPPQRIPGTKGRPRKRGDRLPTPNEMLAERASRVTLNLYGRKDRVRMTDAICHLYAMPERLVKVVATEALASGRGRQAFYTTCYQTSAIDILTAYSWRWSVEVAFHDAKQSLGFEQPQGWTKSSVERTAPVAMLLYDFVVLWFVQEGHREYRPLARPWYPSKSRPAFADMLATLRRVSLREEISAYALPDPSRRKILELLELAADLAA